jgi:hypothetical protein
VPLSKVQKYRGFTLPTASVGFYAFLCYMHVETKCLKSAKWLIAM